MGLCPVYFRKAKRISLFVLPVTPKLETVLKYTWIPLLIQGLGSITFMADCLCLNNALEPGYLPGSECMTKLISAKLPLYIIGSFPPIIPVILFNVVREKLPSQLCRMDSMQTIFVCTCRLETYIADTQTGIPGIKGQPLMAWTSVNFRSSGLYLSI